MDSGVFETDENGISHVSRTAVSRKAMGVNQKRATPMLGTTGTDGQARTALIKILVVNLTI